MIIISNLPELRKIQPFFEMNLDLDVRASISAQRVMCLACRYHIKVDKIRSSPVHRRTEKILKKSNSTFSDI